MEMRSISELSLLLTISCARQPLTRAAFRLSLGKQTAGRVPLDLLFPLGVAAVVTITRLRRRWKLP